MFVNEKKYEANRFQFLTTFPDTGQSFSGLNT